ncbi:MAG: hypothetical protein CBC42_03920 [Betaproteobacteria bacterium TMED82]|nr:MAG: hypothetical protein CBC42_03920 [Betaproteobacteria bacterium TMED82]|tara:strand:- start:54040 stop:54816 length:777 start_codon:yes stop_codon:yes gene_type:complete
MESGSITQYIDVAQIVLYLFWIFFFGLVIYLTIEGKREGFPLEEEGFAKRSNRETTGILPMPSPKVYNTKFHGSFEAPHSRDTIGAAVAGNPINRIPGSPIEPTGENPMLDNIGPGAYTERMDKPDLTVDGDFKLVPMRVESEFALDSKDVDPRGLEIRGLEGGSAGTCVDVWVDRSEHLIRYLEVKTNSGNLVLVPFNLTVIKPTFIAVDSILSGQFDSVPKIKNPNTISLLEEEKVMAFYGAGKLLAYPRRRESIV